MSKPADPRKVRIELRLFECVCKGGTQHVIWLLEERGRWLTLSQMADVELGERESAPGLVWQQRARVPVAVGGRLMQLERRPAPVRHSDPMDYLFAEQVRQKVQSRRRIFVAQPDGSLKLVPPRGQSGSRQGGRRSHSPGTTVRRK